MPSYYWIGILLMPMTIATLKARDWQIPTPDTFNAPGAVEAPASDPKTYVDKEGFEQRKQSILEGLSTADLTSWRKGWFTGGDPGKYLPCHAMAKLVLNRDVESVVELMNDKRSPEEHYHFACVNLSRFYPLFGSIWNDDSKERFARTGLRYGSYLSPSGTENHKTMWVTSANVLPHFTNSGLSTRGKEETLKKAKEMLRNYVKGLFAAGQGEWDSSTYLMFDLNGMLNIYDFSPDPECRLLAKAALDWYVAAYALKYTDGVYTAPNQRGYAGGPVQTIADATGYLWWGCSKAFTSQDASGWRWAIHPILSAYRPSQVLCNLATRKVAVPFKQFNTKPNYWYGLNLEPQPGVYPETVYVTKKYTIGVGWRGHGSQLTRFQLVVATEQGGQVFSGGHPVKSDHTLKKIGFSLTDGSGRYSQFAHHEATVLQLAAAAEDETEHLFSYFTYPAEVEPDSHEEWRLFPIADLTVAVYPIGGKTEIAQTPADKRGHSRNYLRIEGRNSGFAMVVIDSPAAAAKAQLDRLKIDTKKFEAEKSVSMTTLGGKRLWMRMRPNERTMPGESMAQFKVDDQNIEFDAEAIYHGPYIRHRPGKFSVNDGNEGFTIDFTGDLPVYGPWSRE